MTIEPGSTYKGALSANAGQGDYFVVESFGGIDVGNIGFPFFDIYAEASDGAGMLDWTVGGSGGLVFSASQTGFLDLSLYDGMGSNNRSQLNISVVGGLVTELDVTGSFGSVLGLPSLGGSGSFTLSNLPAISIAWNAPNGGLSRFGYDTGGKTKVYSTPVPATVPEPSMNLGMGTITILGLSLLRRSRMQK